ncbi:MAG: TetR/AcrR family transcriptional regulator [Caulobacteraceae bacterium]
MPKLGMEPVRREQIRKAAASIVAKLGFIRTTLADVAKAAKVSTGMINHYYANKTALLIETLNYTSEDTQANMRKECRGKQGMEKIAILAKASMNPGRRGLVNSRIWAWAIAEAIHSKEMSAAIQRRRDAFQELLLEIVYEIAPDLRERQADALALAAELDAYITGLSVYSVSGGRHIEFDAVERSLTAMILHGVKPAAEKTAAAAVEAA